jgi:phosphohistidine phosphatase
MESPVEEAPRRILIVLRHAKSDWSGGEPDERRPLAERGRRQAPEAGRWLAENLETIDLAVVSPAERARSTWKLASAELDDPPTARIDERVYAASVDELVEVVQELPDDVRTAALVGHNPGIEELVGALTGTWAPMPTSALAVIAVAGTWSGAGASTAQLLVSGRPPSALTTA